MLIFHENSTNLNNQNMTEIFLTDIKTKVQADSLLDYFKSEYPELKISYDLNETENPFPCGHTVLRVEGDDFSTEGILISIKNLIAEFWKTKFAANTLGNGRILGRSI